jgi:hypothetical protein
MCFGIFNLFRGKRRNLLRNNFICAVCLDNFGKVHVVAFFCGHLICLKCFSRFKFKKCHICRANVKNRYTFIKNKRFDCCECGFIFSNNNSENKSVLLTCGHLFCQNCTINILRFRFNQYECNVCYLLKSGFYLYP